MTENSMANDQNQLSEKELDVVAGGIDLPIQTPDDDIGDLPIQTPDDDIGDLPIQTPDDDIGDLPIQNPADDDSVGSSEGSDVFTDAPESHSTPPESPPPEAPPAGPFDDVIGEIDDMIAQFPAPPAGEPPVQALPAPEDDNIGELPIQEPPSPDIGALPIEIPQLADLTVDEVTQQFDQLSIDD